MDRSSSSNNSSTASTSSTPRPVRAKQTLLDDWFGNSRKQTGSDFEATGLNLTSHEDSDNDPESAEAVVLETAPLAKIKKSRVGRLSRVDDTIEIGDSSVESDCHSDSDIVKMNQWKFYIQYRQAVTLTPTAQFLPLIHQLC